MKEMEQLTLVNIANGAAEEHFQSELLRVLDNIRDEETGFKEREINIKIKIKPDHERVMGSIEVESSSKLAPKYTSNGSCFFEVSGRKFKAFNQKGNQGELFGGVRNIKD